MPFTKKLKLQDITNYAAVIVATVALFIGWDQARIGRNQQHADVFPVVQFRSQYTMSALPDGTKARHLSLTAFNAGIGPAFVYASDWQIGGKKINGINDIRSFFDEGVLLDYYYGANQNFLLAAKEETRLLSLYMDREEGSAQAVSQFLQAYYEMDLSLCYCSLYDRCWTARVDAQTPKPTQVKQCKE